MVLISLVSGIWCDQPKFYPIEHGFDEMKVFELLPQACIPMTALRTSHPWFPKYNAASG